MIFSSRSLNEPEAQTAPSVVVTFGSFLYAVPDENHVRLHFRNTDADDRFPLGTARVEQRRAELSALFAHLKQSLREDIPVVGASWQYNLEAYRRLFPSSYASTASPIPGGFRSMALWGQFLNRRGEVREAMAAPFLDALVQTSSFADLAGCFPFHALTARAPVREFYDFYGL